MLSAIQSRPCASVVRRGAGLAGLRGLLLIWFPAFGNAGDMICRFWSRAECTDSRRHDDEICIIEADAGPLGILAGPPSPE